MAPGGLFCMSGPVAHADDDDDDDNHFFYSQIQQAALFEPSSFKSQKASAVRQECSIKEESANHRLSDVEFLTDHYSQCCVKFHCSDGTCKMLWSSGSSYKGEVMDGNLHGVGMYTGADGTVYEGNWILNKKHGFGKKQYANGDVYEGLWKWDVPEGKGQYVWSNGSEYGGEWRNGLMCGIGVLTWVGGDSYDGQWLNGLADGHGVYTWADGSVYIGMWKKGLKFGTGKFFSPGRKSMDIVSMPDTCMNLEKLAVAGDELNNGSREYTPDASMDFHKIPVAGERLIDCHDCFKHSKTTLQELISTSEATLYEKLTADKATPTTHDNHEESNLILEKLWRLDSSRGLLNSAAKTNPFEYLEERRSSDYLEERRSSAFCSENVLGLAGERNRDSDLWSIKQEHRPGEIVSKGHRSYDLVTALKLGIRYSVLEVSRGHDRKLFPTDFGPKASVKASLPKESSQLKAYLDSVDFKWIDYCPTVFRRLRELSKVVTASYIQSICGAGGLRELPSPGKSGCLFYLSQDKGFMIKTLRKTEVKTFLRMLPRYYNHIRAYNNTLLTKFFGLHGVKLAGGQKVRFVVMGNVFASEARIDRMYDLKGSSEGRITNRDETTGFAPLKDLDLDVVLQLDPCSRQNVLEQIDRDCKFLESERIMDYSLLLGLQYKNGRQNISSFQERCSKVDLPLHDKMETSFVAQNGVIAEPSAKAGHVAEQHNNTPRISFERLCLEQETEVDYLVPSRQNTQHSAKMQAKTCERPLQGSYDASKSQDVVLHFGIIDILQEYDFSKRLEHAYKSLYFDPLSISAVDPTLYSKRFQQLMHQVFIETT